MSLFRKLTTRPVWNWEKRRPYPVKKQWDQLPPIAGRGTLPMVILTTPAGFDDAMWTAWSWLRFLQAEVSLELVIDGAATAKHRAALERLSPGAGIVTGQEIVAANHDWPENVRALVERHPLGRKFGLLLHYQQRDRVLYLDSDVLAFQKPQELVTALRSPGPVLYLAEPHAGAFDPVVLEAGRAIGLAPRPGFNSGLLLLNRQSLDPSAAAHLAPARTDAASWFTEQTLLALLVPPDAQALPPERYVVSTQRQFYWEHDVDYQAIAARHFTGPVRHVMYLKGLPFLAQAARTFRG